MSHLQKVAIDGATTIGSSSFQNCVQLNTVKFSSCIIINSKAFQSCSLLQKVTIPLVQTIKNYAFSGTELTSIESESLKIIEDYAFSDCSSLSVINAPLLESIGSYCFKGTGFISLKLDNLISMGSDGHCFDSCTKLEIVQIDNVLEIPQYCFSGCNILTTIISASANTIKNNCFSQCIKLATITFPSLLIIGDNAFSSIETITHINLPTVTKVGHNAFEFCSGLVTVILTSCIEIGANAFHDCLVLSKVSVPELKSIYYEAFRNTHIETIELPKLDTLYLGTVNKVNNAGGYFVDCKYLTSITAPCALSIPSLMFLNCKPLSKMSMDIAESIGSSAFSGCSALTSLILPNVKSLGDNLFNAHTNFINIEMNSVISIGNNVFRDCTNLEAISFESCTSIGNLAFCGCSKLCSIDLPNLTYLNIRVFEGTAITDVELNSVTGSTDNRYNGGGTYGGHFLNCKQLTNITMKSLTYIGENMFNGCSDLIYVDVPKVTTIGYGSFLGCTSFSNLDFPNVNSIKADAFNGLNSIISVDLPSVTSIGDKSFFGCPNLETISFESCTSIGNLAFCGCSKLCSIDLPNLTYLNIRVFEGTALTNIELNSVTGSTDNRYNGGGTALTIKQLISVTMKSLPVIGENMFNGCDRLNEIIFESSTSMIGNSFTGCKSIKKITLGFVSIGFGSIPNPTVITHAYFPKALSVPEKAFLNYQELISCILPSVSTIGASAFEGCTRLTELEIPKAIEFTGDKTFYNCESIKSISIQSLVNVNPESQNNFQGCRQLKSILFPNLPPKTFHPDSFSGLTCQFYIPPDSITIYDNDVSVAGDEANDGKWCNIDLIVHQYIKVICDGQDGMGTTLFDACVSTGLLIPEIESLNIIIGQITQNELNLMNEYFANLKELIIYNSVSIENEIIPMNFFKNHNEIQSITILSSLKTIDESAFEGCSKLSSFICKNARELKSRCFYGPTLLESLSFELVDALLGTNFFSNNPKLHTIELPKLTTLSVDGFISENSPLLRSISLPEKPPSFTRGKFLIDVTPNLIGISNDAAIQYDASDGVDHDMKYHSLKLSYILVTCNVDGEAKSGISLKSIISDDSKVVEVIEGKIGVNDFPLPSSVTSFTVQKGVIVETIPKNAFSSNSNLKTITVIPKENKFAIEEEAFNGCKNLESVLINGAISIGGLAFNGCTKLKTVILNDVDTITGNSNFNGCAELYSLSLQSLKNVNADSSLMFLGCNQFTTLTLPSIPPKTFHKNAFSGLHDKINLILPKEADYIEYDKDTSIDGDKMNDGLWCGLILPTSIINIKVNNKGTLITGLKLSDCISASGLPESSIKSLEITRGIINIPTLLETIKKLLFLENLVISKSIKFRGEWTEGLFSGLNLKSINLPSIKDIPNRCFENCASLKEVTLEDAISVSESAFKNCISLETINLRVNTFKGDSIFEGCTSLTSIIVSNLVDVDSTAENIFKGCPLKSITLPINPPKTFNKNTFTGMNVILNGLVDDQLMKYDANEDVEGDVENDYKWCGISLIQLYITISINNGDADNSASLKDAVGSTPIEEVSAIEISQGMIKKIHLDELKSFTQLKTFIITENARLETSILGEEQFKGMTSLIQVKIMQDVSIMKNCFMGCSSITSIEFKKTEILYEGCFKDCSSLNELFIHNCVELKGDFIFSGCSKLPDIDLSSLLKVDNTASNIFEGCVQLKQIKLPSIEPLTFNKDVFASCPGITLKLPNDDNYLAYDDLSHVADDVKEDFKWCGVAFNSSSLPPLLAFTINNRNYATRKLTNVKNDYTTTLKLLDDQENDEKVESLHLTGGGLFNSKELKDFLVGCSEIKTFEADIGTLREILPGTFKDCSVLKEIIIHCEVVIGLGAIANIPSLTKIHIDLQKTLYGEEFDGDTGLQEISLPTIETIPGGLFAGLSNLNNVNIPNADLILGECFKRCTSLRTLQLPKVKSITGNNQFNGCTSLETLELTALEKVSIESDNIFKDCSSLSTLKLGHIPPNIFNDNIFKNAGTIPNVVVPSDNSWRNYASQCSVNPENKHLMWYGFQTPLTEDDNTISCPEPSECSCPEPSEFSCPEPSEFSCPEPSEFSCPEQTEISCPDQSECSCPEIPVVSCPEQKNETTLTPETIIKKENNNGVIIALGVICGILVVGVIVRIVLYVIHLKKSADSFSEDLNGF